MEDSKAPPLAVPPKGVALRTANLGFVAFHLVRNHIAFASFPELILDRLSGAHSGAKTTTGKLLLYGSVYFVSVVIKPDLAVMVCKVPWYGSGGLRPTWGPYGPHMGPIWAPYESIWGHMGPYGPILAHMGPMWGPYGPHMSSYTVLLGPLIVRTPL